MHILEHKLPPPLLVVLVGAAMWAAVHASAPAASSFGPWPPALAVAFAVAGLLITALGIAAFRRAETTVDPVRIERAAVLVTGGVFRRTRNPMYVGFTALLVAWVCWLSVPWTLCGPLAFALFITRFQIVPEERVMSAKFGAEYADYRRRVRRWL